MNSVVIDIDINPSKPFTLIPLSDVHVGAAEHDKKLFADTVKYIKEKEAHTILLGDMIEAIQMRDRRWENDSLSADFKPFLDNLHHAQTKSVIKTLMPIKEQILGNLEGNHESALKSMVSYDATKVISEELGVKYLTDPSFMILRFRNGGTTRDVRLWLSHGVFIGGGKLSGNKVNNLENKASQFEADIYLAGHSHNRFVTTRTNMIINNNGTIKENRKVFCNTGSFVKSYTEGDTNSWVSRSGFPPLQPGCVRIDFYLKRDSKGSRYIDIHARA